MKLILARHGETIENKKGLLQGWMPGRLSTEGKRQAKELTKKLPKIDYIYASDLKRCLDTAKIIKKKINAEIILDERIRERNWGKFQGKKAETIDWSKLSGTYATNKPPQGESFKEMWKRVKRFYKDLLKKHRNDTILIIGHGGSIKLLRGLIKSLKLTETLKLESPKHTTIEIYKI